MADSISYGSKKTARASEKFKFSNLKKAGKNIEALEEFLMSNKSVPKYYLEDMNNSGFDY